MTPQITIVHVIGNLRGGGAERSLLNLAIELRDLGFARSFVLVLSETGELRRDFINNSVDFVHIFNPASLLKIIRTIKNDKILLLGWMYHGSLLSGLIGTVTKRPFALTLRGELNSTLELKAATRLTLLLLKPFVARAGVAIFNSEKALADHERILGRIKNAKVIPNPLSRLFINRPIVHDRKTVRTFVLTCLARWHPSKGHRFLFEALEMNLVNVNENSPYLLQLAGAGINESNTALMGLLELNPKLRACTQILGFCEDTTEVLAKTDILILPSVSGEGYPNVINEALSLGIPVIATKSGDTELIVGSAGLVVPPANADALRLAISNMTSEQYMSYKRAAINRAEEIRSQCSPEKIASLYAAELIPS